MNVVKDKQRFLVDNYLLMKPVGHLSAAVCNISELYVILILSWGN